MSLAKKHIPASSFSINKVELLKALAHIQAIVDKRNATPILTNFKVDVFPDGNIKLSSTDTQISAIDLVPAHAANTGSFTLPAVIYDIARKLPEGEVTFTYSAATDSQVIITLGGSTFTLPSLPPETFPNFEAGELDYKFTLPSKALYSLLTKTKHSMSLEEQRYYLNGIYIHTVDEGATLRFVATDGHRLAYAQTSLAEPLKDFPGVILPKKAVNELCRLLDSEIKDINIGVSSKKMQFIVGQTTLITKLIDAKFADYQKAVPQDSGNILEISSKDLARCADLVTSISAEKVRVLRMEIKDNQLILSATSEMNQHATGKQVLEANYSGSDTALLAFNAKYLLDALSAIEGDKVRFFVTDSFKAVKIEDAEDKDALYVLMPMQI